MDNSLTYAEIKRKLKEPIERKYISTKTVGGKEIKYVSITDIKDQLDSRLAPNHWEAIVKSTTVAGETLLMIISLIIHADDGVFCQDGTGIEKTTLRGYGDIGSNSFAQGLRRAAESHGLGRELWRDELSDEQKEIQREAKPQQAVQVKPATIMRIRNAEKAIADLGGEVEPFNAAGKTEDELNAELDALTDQFKRLREVK